MENRDISVLMMKNMNYFHDFLKVINQDRYSKERILTERQFFALISMREFKKIELKNLSKKLYVSTSSLCILLNKLVDQNYVYREEDSRDRRNTFYGITEYGEEVLKIEINKLVEILSSRIEVLNEEDKQIMYDSLKNIEPIMAKLF
ncbi:MarR family transcriptional regulator [Romboutsia maritimum]|uniref:MarR family transcriptional regulator n=1 Tax=Romboutsia maritimum TaxID=2020948 RepID=A0A371IW98_9FIRM|nr:MarR family winged helix-turn-helix transcriptional regulator [Romboutsia maritimum]RDY24764.1 MarR family transcriptional regulator [Romboutsia maritimum]